MNMQIATITLPGNGVTAGNQTMNANTSGTIAAGSGFSDALGQLISGGVNQSQDEPADALTLTLAALLGGLFMQMNPNTDVALPNEAQTEQLAQAVAQVNEMLDAQPELLQQLLARPEMQAWLQKAQGLLQGMNGMQEVPSLQQTKMSGQTFDEILSASTAEVSTGEQAKNIITQLLNAAQAEPSSILVSELVQDLSTIVGASNQSGEMANRKNQGDIVTLPGLKHESVVRAKTPKLATDAGTNSDRTVTASGASSRLAFSVNAEPVKSKLEMLAAKATPSVIQSGAVPEFSNDNLSEIGVTDLSNLQQLIASSESAEMLSNAAASKPEIATNAQHFVQDMSQFVMKNFKIAENGAFSEAKLSLSPANLGHVDVKITMHDGQVVAHFMAQTAVGKEMLESQMSQLRSTLQNLGLQVERLDVTHNSALSSGMFQDQRGQQSSQQQGKQQSAKSDELDFIEDFTTEMKTIAELRNLAYGNRFNVTA